MDISELNERQKEAVLQTEGPVMVMAGAGSGKTKVLTYRIAYLINELNVSPYSILAVTFTNKAANEMKERISSMVNINTSKMWISTFHSFCAKLLRFEIDALPPYNSRFNIADDDDTLKIIRDIVKEQMLETKPKELKNAISKVKNGLSVSNDDPIFLQDFQLVSLKYEEFLENNNLLDFDDLIIKTLELFKKNPDILLKYQNRFKYVLVDEFQDTNTLQYDLMFMLSARYHNLFVVGDDFQSIYSFRGAKIENINRFRKDFLETKLILLERNYRSTFQILNLANCIIDKNPNQIKKIMFTDNNEGNKPYYYKGHSSYEEVSFVIDKIKNLKMSGYNYSDIAILYRANYVSRNFEDSLIRYQIPYRIFGGVSFFQRKEIKDIVSYLRVVINNDDDFSFKRIVNEPKRKIGTVVLEKLIEASFMYNKSLFNSIPHYDGSGAGANALRSFYNNIKEIEQELESVSLPDLVDIVLYKMSYIDALKADMDTYDDRLDNARELKSFLKESDEFYEGSNREKLEAVLLDLALRTDNDKAVEADSVILATFHQVKGLEFKAVFMVAFEEEIFPSARTSSYNEIEEERRICYVGLTRAKTDLFLTTADSRFLFGSQRNLLPSRFLREMDSKLYDTNIRRIEDVKKVTPTVAKKDDVRNTISIQTSKNEFKLGDKLEHQKFGKGVVISALEKSIMVAFPVPYGIKQLMSDHPAIKKIEK